MTMYDKTMNLIHKNRFGFYELKEKPTPEKLAKYYSKEYYQKSLSNYKKTYSEAEISYLKIKLEEKYIVLKNILPDIEDINTNFLDIGAGEGWAIDFFNPASRNSSAQ